MIFDKADLQRTMRESLRDYMISRDCDDRVAERDSERMAEWLMDAVIDEVVPTYDGARDLVDEAWTKSERYATTGHYCPERIGAFKSMLQELMANRYRFGLDNEMRKAS